MYEDVCHFFMLVPFVIAPNLKNSVSDLTKHLGKVCRHWKECIKCICTVCLVQVLAQGTPPKGVGG